ncbi:MAG TPA: PLP-dependent aminotransferase family protein [Spirochaetota bacterium]|nr:PLP-dependent aminotransferase family protein [Spirochaetota bacterium]HOR45372.1 PLP-dependent aminotransferase family protein [Spirochaetota bacterium]HPK57227.1 PLP-dependent aminotransferase family protein [Spirochaetota bacterium]
MTDFSIILSGGKPVFMQIADKIEKDIFTGKLSSGDMLPSVRDLAAKIKVNTSTVYRAYKEAEKRGLISGSTGSGTYISSTSPQGISIASPEPRSPGMIEMGIVSPLVHLDPDMNEILQIISRRKTARLFSGYNQPEGMMRHRSVAKEWLKRYGIIQSEENIIICAGSQHALTCSLLSNFREGDRIAADEMTYPGMKTLAGMLRIKLVPVRSDSYGMIPEELASTCRRDKIKGLYIMPSMQNPTLCAMNERRRDQIAQTASQHSLTVIEDDAYIHTAEIKGNSVFCRIPERTIYIAGISKAFGAGLRISFVCAAPAIRQNIASAVLNSLWMAPPLNAEIITSWIKNGEAEKTIEVKRTEAVKRNIIARKILSGYKIASAPSGYFIYLKLPEETSGTAFENIMKKEGISLFSSDRFSIESRKHHHGVRISLTGSENIEDMKKGLLAVKKRLSEI